MTGCGSSLSFAFVDSDRFAHHRGRAALILGRRVRWPMDGPAVVIRVFGRWEQGFVGRGELAVESGLINWP